ncbi:hypothetical protein N566_08075 [Streptomycetaceae bacterium MP113-05]|nr:hypothetical protein N566_08075 [Streptomycetaceae bacterium MP113-05]
MSTIEPADREAASPARVAADGQAEDGPGVAELEAEIDRLRTEVTQLRQAMASRSVNDQARGMVMVMARCPPQVAWEVLVEVSQHTNTKLREVAAALVATAHGRTKLPQPLGAELAAALRRRR